MKIRQLKAKEIKVRVGICKESGLSLLLYVDSRAAMDLLDETFGVLGWKRTHFAIGDDTYCRISVYDTDEKQWISRDDVGTAGNYEKEKSTASDAFKRAAVNWGIGRELYSAPFIWVNKSDCTIKSYERNGKKTYSCDDIFRVNAISYKDSKIDSLQIVRTTKSGDDFKTVHVTYPEKKVSHDMIKTLDSAIDRIKKYKPSIEQQVLDMANIKKLSDMSVLDYKAILKRLLHTAEMLEQN